MQSLAVQVYRQPPVLVEVDQVAGLTADEGAAGGGRARCDRGGWSAGSAAVETASPTATLTLRPNRPEVEAEQVIRLVREGKSWNADVRLPAAGQRGLVGSDCVGCPGVAGRVR